MKWIELNPTRNRTIRLRKLGKRDSKLLLETLSEECFEADKIRNSDTDKQDTLLLKEIDETNSWARLAFQMYFGWFALQFTINAVAMGWLFTNKGPMPSFARLIFAVLLGWNLMGTVTTLVIRKRILDCDLRIRDVVSGLTQHHKTLAEWSQVRSPMPRQAISIVFVFCALTTSMSVVFWTVLEIWPLILVANSPGSP